MAVTFLTNEDQIELQNGIEQKVGKYTRNDNILDSMRTKNTIILIRQDWFIVDWYQRSVASSANYIDIARFNELKKLGDAALANDDIDQLRQILFELLAIKISSDSGDGMFDIANIVKG